MSSIGGQGGANEFFALLNILRDPATYEQRVKELDARMRRISDAATNIDKARDALSHQQKELDKQRNDLAARENALIAND